MRNLFYVFGISLLLIGCGGSNQGGTEPPVQPPQKEADAVKLLLFSAQWCDPCKAEIRELEKTIPERLGDKRDKLEVIVYVQTGMNKLKEPTKKDLEEFKKELGTEYSLVADLDDKENSSIARWPTYKKYIKANRLIPAAAVLNKDNSLRKAFEPGTFKPVDVLDYLANHFNEAD